ncbi:MAG: GNAT family N-acetyltransferase [Cyanobacteria bacterium J06626_18]
MVVSLREITADTVHQITDLAVKQGQEHFIASNAVSLAQALFHEEAWYRAIYNGESPVGFVMLYDETLRSVPPAEPKITLWRFMVDAKFQRQGIGKAALELVIDYVRSRGIFAFLITSYVPGPGCAEGFYRSHGFRPNGKTDEEEIVLELPLR